MQRIFYCWCVVLKHINVLHCLKTLYTNHHITTTLMEQEVQQTTS